MPATLHPASQPVAPPSPAEIRRRCLEIQATWTAETRRKRAVFKVEPWMLKAVEIHLPQEQESYGEFPCVA